MKRFRFLLLTIPLIAVSQTVPVDHPHHHAMDANGHIPLVVSVDGSKTPELIPDATAYYHYFATVSHASNPMTPEEAAKQKRILSHIGLTEADEAGLISAMASFKSQLDPITAERNSSPTAARFTELQMAEANLVTTARNTVSSRLSSAGAAKLDQYVQTFMKAHIVMYTEAPQ